MLCPVNRIKIWGHSFEKYAKVKNYKCQKVQKSGQRELYNITKMQEVHSMHSNGASSRCTGWQMPIQNFCRNFMIFRVVAHPPPHEVGCFVAVG